jgi:hypothetical protein
VTLNGFTYGIYVVVEAIDGDFLEAAFGNGKGNLYEGTFVDFVDAPEQVELKDEAEDMRHRDDLIALAAVVRDTPDDALEAELAARLDLDGFIRGYAIDALLHHWDGYALGANNYYLYADAASGRLVFLPHGMDQLLQDPSFDPFSPAGAWLARRVREVPALDQRFHVAVADVLAQAWDVPGLQARVDAIKEVLHSTTRSDERVAGDLQAFDERVDATRALLAERPGQIAM